MIGYIKLTAHLVTFSEEEMTCYEGCVDPVLSSVISVLRSNIMMLSYINQYDSI